MAENCRLVEFPSNFSTEKYPAAAPGWEMEEVLEPTSCTGTFRVKLSSHCQVWSPRTSAEAAMSWPRSHTEKEMFLASSLGIRISRGSNLTGKHQYKGNYSTWQYY